MIEPLLEIPFPGRAFAAPADDGRSAGRRLPSFVAGPENRLPAAAFLRLARSRQAPAVDDGSHLPVPSAVAVYGPTGAGKTHLLRGLVDDWNGASAGSAEYLTSGDFRREFAEAMGRGAILPFRRRLRSRRLLAIDDLDELPDDAQLMEELRNTLDDCEEAAAHVVVASSRAPTTMANLAAGVRSRLAGGLIVPLSAPGRSAKRLLVRRAATALDCRISDPAVRRLADALDGVASRLFTAVAELALGEPTSEEVDLPQVERYLADRFARRTTLRDVIAIVARYYGLPQRLLKSGSRKHAVVTARSTIVYLARVVLKASYEQIGQALGGRDHSTMMYNFRTIDRERRRDARTQETLDELRRVLVAC